MCHRHSHSRSMTRSNARWQVGRLNHWHTLCFEGAK
jgi:hypothetical protein